VGCMTYCQSGVGWGCGTRAVVGDWGTRAVVGGGM